MGWADRLSPESVVDVETFIDYAQQEVGTRPITKAIVTKTKKVFKGLEVDWLDVCSFIARVKDGHWDTANLLAQEYKNELTSLNE